MRLQKRLGVEASRNALVNEAKGVLEDQGLRRRCETRYARSRHDDYHR
jgi:hypothetical protein